MKLNLLAMALLGSPSAVLGLGSPDTSADHCEVEDVSLVALRAAPKYHGIKKPKKWEWVTCSGAFCFPIPTMFTGTTACLALANIPLYSDTDGWNLGYRCGHEFVFCERRYFFPPCSLACSTTAQVPREPPRQPGPRVYGDVLYDDAVVIAQTNAADMTDNCGLYGCRVAGMPQCWSSASEGYWPWGQSLVRGKEPFFGGTEPVADPALVFMHGSSIPSGSRGFLFRRPVGSAPGAACVSYGDSVVMAFTANAGKTQNCGWYGCRVAYMDADRLFLRFDHGGDAPAAFFIRPPAGAPRSGCVKYGDDVVIAQTPQESDTHNCGWYGCRVAYMKPFPGDGAVDHQPALAGAMYFGHGGTEPQAFYLRPEFGRAET